jgi:hypothetical protein
VRLGEFSISAVNSSTEGAGDAEGDDMAEPKKTLL